MAEARWTASLVAERLEEAAATLYRLPPVRVQGYVSLWPPIVREFWEAFGWEPTTVRLGPPSASAISRMDQALEWLCSLEPAAARIVWLRACNVPWKPITHRMGMGRTKAWQEWVAALENISIRLNRKGECNGIRLNSQAKPANNFSLNNANRI